ncbi:unnamed protein product [Peronospora belbahrii]|uniref:25S rRNA (uridine-N(3))-methyltransferase BMT5-like domain-containing protein n=1 Tax=Peronospora belbahrii TaxID=622444 RepID=A0ABN8CZN6_9STRA|nr:unnamed protein product [Peronospora belbahrii]
MARNKSDALSQKRRFSKVYGGMSSGSNTKRQRQKPQKIFNQVYAPEDTVLVLGDGDFSFSRSLVKHRGTGRGVFATSFDSEKEVGNKYSNAPECMAAVKSAQGLVLHDVDATKLLELPRQVKTGMGMKMIPDFFQYIVFNFPHSGQQRVHINRALLLNFFESARNRLLLHGEAHVTLKTRPPYSNWFIEDQAKDAGFVMKDRRRFDIRLFPGYRHRTTDPRAKTFEPDLCVTYVFVVNRSKYPFQQSRAALNAASAKTAAIQASEWNDLATTIVNIANAQAPDSTKMIDKTSVGRSLEPKTSRKRSAVFVACHEQQAKKIRPLHVLPGVLWKPLHRQLGGIYINTARIGGNQYRTRLKVSYILRP